MKKFAMLFLSGIFFLGLTHLSAQPYSAGGYPVQRTSQALHPINWLISYSDAVAAAKSSSKPIAILFTGTGWCPACIKLEREVLTNSEFAGAVSQSFVFLKAEFPDYSPGAVAASPYKFLIDRYNITMFPTIVVIDPNGQQLYTINYGQKGAQAYAQELLQKLQQSKASVQ